MQTHLSCFNSKNDLSYTVRQVNFSNSLNKEKTTVDLTDNDSLELHGTCSNIASRLSNKFSFFFGKLQERRTKISVKQEK